VLTPQEADALMVIMRTLKSQGKSIIFITHKLKEVLEIADVITVMRLGQVVGTTTPAETNEAALATMMVGRDVNLVVEKPPANPGEVVLDVTNLFVQDDRGLTAVKESPSRCVLARSSRSPGSKETGRPNSSRRSPGCDARLRVRCY